MIVGVGRRPLWHLLVDPECVGPGGEAAAAAAGRRKGMLYLRNNSRGENTEGVRAADEVQQTGRGRSRGGSKSFTPHRIWDDLKVPSP